MNRREAWLILRRRRIFHWSSVKLKHSDATLWILTSNVNPDKASSLSTTSRQRMISHQTSTVSWSRTTETNMPRSGANWLRSYTKNAAQSGHTKTVSITIMPRNGPGSTRVRSEADVEAHVNGVEVPRVVAEPSQIWNSLKRLGRMENLFLAQEQGDLDVQRHPHSVKWRLTSIQTLFYRHKDEFGDRPMQMGIQKRSAGEAKPTKIRRKRLRTRLLQRRLLVPLSNLTAKTKRQVSKLKMTLGNDRARRCLLQYMSASMRINSVTLRC